MNEFMKIRMPLFAKSQKSPGEVVKGLKDAVVALEKGEKRVDKAQEDVAKHLTALKNLLMGADYNDSNDIMLSNLAQEMYTSDLLIMLVNNLPKVDFESKKDVCTIFNNLLRRQIGSRHPTVDYLVSKPQILFTLVNGYKYQEISLICGSMLRECARHEALTRIIITSDEFYTFFQFVEVSNFEMATDAFMTFKELITKHKILSADYLENNYDKFFDSYQHLLHSENYATRRQSLKLLGELLLDRHNFSVMTRYISNPDNLKLMMNILRDKSRNIQFEAFHVFKVFVANPNKPKPILDILLRNQEKLVDFLSNFHTDRSDDEQFNDEKSYLIRQIRDLRPSDN
ncbi:protein Mo25-like [Artemia franciscana]